MSYRLEFELSGLPPTTNGSHGTWQAAWQRRKRWRDAVKLRCVMQRPVVPLQLSKVVMIRFSSRQPDYDNLVTSFKSVRDGLKDAGIIFDDSPNHIREEYRWEKCNSANCRIRVEVEEL